MAHCINIKSPEYLALVKQSKYGQRELKARIAAWQEINNDYNTFPTIEQLDGLISDNVSAPAPVITEATLLRDNFSNVDIDLATQAIGLLRIYDKGRDILGMKKSLNLISSGAIRDNAFNSAFVESFVNLTSDVEKSAIYQELSPKGRMYELLVEMYDDYLTYPEMTDFGRTINQVFERMVTAQEMLNKDPYLVQDLLRSPKASSKTSKSKNDKTLIYSKGKNAGRIRADIEGAMQDLKRAYGENADIRVSERSSAKHGTYYVVYVNHNNSFANEDTLISEKEREKLLANKQELFGDKNTSTAKELLEKISKSKSGAGIAKALLPFMNDDISVEFINTDYLSNSNYNFQTKIDKASGLYSAETNHITLPIMGMKNSTILHEILHGMTVRHIQRNPDNAAVRDFIKLFEHAKEALKDDNLYGLSNVYEFVPALFTDTRAINKLKQLETVEGVKEYRNLFQQLFDKILDFFNISRKKNFYHQAFSIASNIMEDNFYYLEHLKEMDLSAYSEEELARFNDNFMAAPVEETIQDSPYTQALKNVNAKFKISEWKDIATTIAQEFSATVSEYHKQYPEMTREEFISYYTPAQIFEDLREQFNADYSDYYYNENISEDQVLNMYKAIENFDDLAMMAVREINFLEGLKFNVGDSSVYKYSSVSESDSGHSNIEDMNNELEFHEESTLDGWQKNFKHSSVADSLTSKVKRALSDINEVDFRGNNVRNTIGYSRKMNMDIIKNALLSNLQNVITSKDLLPALGIMSKSKPWVKSIVEALENDNELYSQFYSIFKKDFATHSIINVSVGSNNLLTYKPMVINKSGDPGLWLENWKSDIENKVIYNDIYSIYNTLGNLVPQNIEKNLNILTELNKEWLDVVRQKSLEARKDFVARKGVTIKNQLNAVGVGVTIEQLKDMTMDTKTNTEEIKALFGVEQSSFSVDNILNKLIGINSWAKNNAQSSAYDVFKENNNNYNALATLASNSLEDLVEGSVHENGKSYYTYLQPSYLSKLTKQLKNVQNNAKAFDDFIQQEFRQYEGTLYNSNTKTFNIPWLNDLADKRGAKDRELFDHKIVLSFDKVGYSALSDSNYQKLLLAEYFLPSKNAGPSDQAKAWYHVPILAEAPSAEFIQYKRIVTNYKDNVTDSLLDTFVYEYNRILTVEGRKEGIANGTIQAIKNFDDNGDKFHFLEFLNPHLKEIRELIENSKAGRQAFPNEVMTFVKGLMMENLDREASNAITYLDSLGLLETKGNKYIHLNDLGITPENLVDKMTEYFYNSYLATTNIIQLTSTDLSYYKNVEDFQKRNKEIHAPGTMVNTDARYKGNRIGKDIETYIILADQSLNSTETVYEAVKEALSQNEKLSKSERAHILSMYSNNKGAHNVTDAQAYRSLESAKTVIAMSTGWNDKLEASYKRLNSGQWSMEDYNTILQAFKPFVYTQTTVDSGILVDPKDPGKGTRKIKVPVQHKNSESILIPMHNVQFKSAKLGGIMRAMSEGKIDVAMFESAVKVGLQGIIDINNLNTEKEVADYILSFRDDNQIFKTISYEDYKIQQPVPEHLQDTSQLFGTQFRKLLLSDIPKDGSFSINIKGKDFNRDEVVKLYNDVILENTIKSYERVKERFADSTTLQEAINNELINNSRYSQDLINAARLDKDGKFMLPLFDPSQSNRIQQLVNSIWKSEVTKQKIKGGKAVQMSSFGLSDNLELKFRRVDGKIAIDYMEAYLPFWSETIPSDWESRGFIDPNTGIMDAQKMLDEGVIDEKFLEGISYRIPTEDSYSMWNIKVKGFLPRNAGGNIVLPREITTITGSDFDVDSMYLMLKEFKFKTDYNFKNAWGEFYDNHPEMLEALKSKKEQDKVMASLEKVFTKTDGFFDVSQTDKEFKDESGISKAFRSWFANNKSRFAEREYFETVDADINKPIEDMTTEERNNLLIDISRAVLSHPNTVTKQLNPGNFDGPKATARRLNILASGQNVSWESLEKMNIDELDKLASKNTMSILNYTTQVKLHKQNMTAAKLIGIIANHSTNHVVRQNTEIALRKMTVTKVIDGKKVKVEVPQFILDGKSLEALNGLISDDGHSYISKNFASFLAASVDAVKDPVLSYFNLNTFTADSAMLLTGLGYDFDTIGLLLRQPIVEDLVRSFERAGGRKSKNQVISEVLDKYNDYAESLGGGTIAVDTEGFSKKSLANMISLGARFDKASLELSEEDKAAFFRDNTHNYISYLSYQIEVLNQYASILEASQQLADFVRASKADTGNGGAGPTIADTEMKMRNIRKNSQNASDSNSRLVNNDIISLYAHDNPESAYYKMFDSIERTRETLREAPLGFIQGFTTLGLQATGESLSKYFPYYNNYYVAILDALEEHFLKSGKINVDLTNMIYSDFMAYYMSQFQTFSVGTKNSTFSEKIMEASPQGQDAINKVYEDFLNDFDNIKEDDSEAFVKLFPYEFQRKLAKYPDLKNLYLIKGISVVNPSETVSVPKLQFRSGGKLSSTVRDTMIMEWESLLYTPEYRSLAIDLFRYNFYVNGFNFGATSFMHLAPTAVKLEVPGYAENLYKMLDMKLKTETSPTDESTNAKTIPVEESLLYTFLDQFYRNHLGNRKLVPIFDANDPNTFKNKESGGALEYLKITLPFREVSSIATPKKYAVPYVSVKVGEEEVFYRVIDNTAEEDLGEFANLEFVRVNPLGVKNNFLEYSYNDRFLESNYTQTTLDKRLEVRDRGLITYADVTSESDYVDEDIIVSNQNTDTTADPNLGVPAEKIQEFKNKC